MLLKFNHKYLSIDQFDEIEIGSMTVITGMNGTGKSHLFEAIKIGAVSVGNIQSDEIVRFDYDSFKLENETFSSAKDITTEKDNAWANLQNVINSTSQQYRSLLAKRAEKIAPNAQSEAFWETQEPGLQQYRSALRDHLYNHQSRNQPWVAALFNYIKSIDRPVTEVDREFFDNTYRPVGLKSDFLPRALGSIVWDYYIRWMENAVNRMQYQDGSSSYDFLTEEDFLQKNGEKPWILMNKILRGFGTLEYEFSSPEGHGLFKNFYLKLVSTKTPGLEVQFQNLSSGERVLMALVASAYNYASRYTFPKVLLLDEIDATLHPSMSKSLFAIIQQIFLPRGTLVMLATHSPSTVALAEEGDVLVMHKGGTRRLSRTSKKDAITVLTEGFATLEEGILLFDQTTSGNLYMISEGKNISLIKRALEINHIDGVSFIENVESITGKNQLKTLFDYMIKVPHRSKIIFVWDCDVKYNLVEDNSTFPFVFSKNSENQIAQSGIENLFPESVFSGFITTIITSRGQTKNVFDESRKKEFGEMLLNEGNPQDFLNFAGLIEEISRIKSL